MVFILFAVMAFAAGGVIWSIVSIVRSTQHRRETMLETLEASEQEWDGKYSQELRGVKVSVILDIEVYNQTTKEIKEIEGRIKELEKQRDEGIAKGTNGTATDSKDTSAAGS